MEGMEGFEYIVNPPPIPKVAFGTSLYRETLPTKGPCLSAYMRRMQGEIYEYPGPFEYVWMKGLEKPYPSKLGFSAMVSKIPRLIQKKTLETPPAYDTEKPKIFQPNNIPLGGSGLRTIEKVRSPGPANYLIPRKWPRVNVTMAFGKCRKIHPAVHIFCTPRNTANCYECGITPCGDYFHNFGNKLDLCRPCMKLKIKELKACDVDTCIRSKSYRKLSKFCPARYCGFFHDHGGTTAAVQLISRKTLIRKTELETYLYKYTKESKRKAFLNNIL